MSCMHGIKGLSASCTSRYTNLISFPTLRGKASTSRNPERPKRSAEWAACPIAVPLYQLRPLALAMMQHLSRHKSIHPFDVIHHMQTNPKIYPKQTTTHKGKHVLLIIRAYSNPDTSCYKSLQNNHTRPPECLQTGHRQRNRRKARRPSSARSSGLLF